MWFIRRAFSVKLAMLNKQNVFVLGEIERDCDN